MPIYKIQYACLDDDYLGQQNKTWNQYNFSVAMKILDGVSGLLLIGVTNSSYPVESKLKWKSIMKSALQAFAQERN